MKKIFYLSLLAGWLAPLLASGAMVTGNTVDAIGDPNVSFMLFKARVSPASGTNAGPGSAVRVNVDGSNNFSADLSGGYYDAYFGSDLALKELRILVPQNDTNTYTLNQVAQLAVDDPGMETGKPAPAHSAPTAIAPANPQANAPAADNPGYFDTSGAIWPAIPTAQVVLYYREMADGKLTNAACILDDITNNYQSGWMAMMQSNGTPVVISLGNNWLVRNRDGSFGEQTNFFRTPGGIADFASTVHRFGCKIQGSYFVNSTLAKPEPGWVYFTTSSGPIIYQTNLAMVSNPALFFGQPPDYYTPIVTPSDVPAMTTYLYSIGFDGCILEDMSVPAESYRIMEQSAAYYSLYPPALCPGCLAGPWNVEYPARTQPLWILAYESMFYDATNRIGVWPAPDTYTARNGFFSDAFPTTGQFGTSGPICVKMARYVKAAYPNADTTSHGFNYMTGKAGMNQQWADLAAICSFSVGPYPAANRDQLQYFTNASWAAIHNDPLQNFPALIDFGVNLGSAWVKKKFDGNHAVAFFNESPTPQTFKVNWPQAGIPDGTPIAVSDMRGNLLGIYNHAFSARLGVNDSCLLNFNQTNLLLMTPPAKANIPEP